MTTMTAHFGTATAHAVASKLAAMLHSLANMFEAKAVAVEKPVAKTTAKRKLQTLASIYSMASQYEAAQPNLAAELRYIASRG